jgi:hypothetical protein
MARAKIISNGPCKQVIIKEDDIGGVTDSGNKAIIAVLTFPDVETKWLMLDAGSMHAGKYILFYGQN